MTDDHVITATEAAWIEAQHQYNALADTIVSSERTIHGSHGLHAEGEYTCSCGESFTSWSTAKEHLHRTAPDTPEPAQHTTELLTILTHIEDLAGSSLIGDIVSDARLAIESGTNPDDVQEELSEAVTIAVEADYRQRVIDALMLATEHLSNTYSVPSGNLPDDILPSEYPDDLREQDSLSSCLDPELETILERIEDLTGDVLIPTTAEVNHDDLVESLQVTERVAIEANYSQETIDTVKLALEYIDGQYTVPPANITDDILPEAYPIDELSQDQ